MKGCSVGCLIVSLTVWIFFQNYYIFWRAQNNDVVEAIPYWTILELLSCLSAEILFCFDEHPVGCFFSILMFSIEAFGEIFYTLFPQSSTVRHILSSAYPIESLCDYNKLRAIYLAMLFVKAKLYLTFLSCLCNCYMVASVNGMWWKLCRQIVHPLFSLEIIQWKDLEVSWHVFTKLIAKLDNNELTIGSPLVDTLLSMI